MGLLAAIFGPPFAIVFSKNSNPGDLLNREELIEAWLFLGPFLFLVCFIGLLFDEKRKARRDAITDRFPQSQISEFSVRNDNRTIELVLTRCVAGTVLITVGVSFENADGEHTDRETRFDVGFNRRGGAKIRISKGADRSVAAQEIARLLMKSNPPVIPVKWKNGTLTVSRKGMQYTEGPYDLGPLAYDLVGNLVIVKGLKAVAEKVESVWTSVRW